MSSVFTIIKRRLFGESPEPGVLEPMDVWEESQTIKRNLDRLETGPSYGRSLQAIRQRDEAFDKFQIAIDKYKVVIDTYEGEIEALREANRVLSDRVNNLEQAPRKSMAARQKGVPEHLLERAAAAREKSVHRVDSRTMID